MTRWASGWRTASFASRRNRGPTASPRLCCGGKADWIAAMPRDIPVGNGSLLAAFDSHYRLADLYFPHVGMENHAGSRFRFGVWDGTALSWVADASWQRTNQYLRETCVNDFVCERG